MSKRGQPITVVAVDDHPLIRTGIRTALADCDDIHLVGEGSAGEEILPLIQAHSPDVLLLDIGLPPRAGEGVQKPGRRFPVIATVEQLRRSHPATKILIVSQYDTPSLVNAAVSAGVQGYLLKDDALSDRLVDAVRSVQHGGWYFSEQLFPTVRGRHEGSPMPQLQARQRQLLALLAVEPELSRREIAERLQVSEHTVNHHLRGLYQALGVNTLAAALMRALNLGILPVLDSGAFESDEDWSRFEDV